MTYKEFTVKLKELFNNCDIYNNIIWSDLNESHFLMLKDSIFNKKDKLNKYFSKNDFDNGFLKGFNFDFLLILKKLDLIENYDNFIKDNNFFAFKEDESISFNDLLKIIENAINKLVGIYSKYDLVESKICESICYFFENSYINYFIDIKSNNLNASFNDFFNRNFKKISSFLNIDDKNNVFDISYNKKSFLIEELSFKDYDDEGIKNFPVLNFVDENSFSLKVPKNFNVLYGEIKIKDYFILNLDMDDEKFTDNLLLFISYFDNLFISAFNLEKHMNEVPHKNLIKSKLIDAFNAFGSHNLGTLYSFKDDKLINFQLDLINSFYTLIYDKNEDYKLKDNKIIIDNFKLKKIIDYCIEANTRDICNDSDFNILKSKIKVDENNNYYYEIKNNYDLNRISSELNCYVNFLVPEWGWSDILGLKFCTDYLTFEICNFLDENDFNISILGFNKNIFKVKNYKEVVFDKFTKYLNSFLNGFGEFKFNLTYFYDDYEEYLTFKNKGENAIKSKIIKDNFHIDKSGFISFDGEISDYYFIDIPFIYKKENNEELIYLNLKKINENTTDEIIFIFEYKKIEKYFNELKDAIFKGIKHSIESYLIDNK